jgi:hypothetical protein
MAAVDMPSPTQRSVFKGANSKVPTTRYPYLVGLSGRTCIITFTVYWRGTGRRKTRYAEYEYADKGVGRQDGE